jgi:ssDNA-binding Zn-finger/Zn-ribbon topoisomerase 1
MLKRLLNTPERITYGRLRDVCARHEAAVYPKVRLADVLPIENSGLSDVLYEFALQGHYDFVVTGRDEVPIFAIEFDGPQHRDSPQAERDVKKDELSSRFRFPLFRVHAKDLCRTESQLDNLSELIERWFHDHAQQNAGGVVMQATPKCPLCGGEMVRKNGKYGPFFSCVRYPDCTGACDLPEAPNRPAGSKTPLVVFAIGAAVVISAVLLLRFPSGTPEGSAEDAAEETRPALVNARSSMSVQEKRAYARSLKESESPSCPRCGKHMVIRNNTSTGEPFFGCSQFPRCRGTRDVHYPK